MFTIGADGRVRLDDATQQAQQLFGLGRRRFGRRLRKLVKWSPLIAPLTLTKKLVAKPKKKKTPPPRRRPASVIVPEESGTPEAMDMTSAPSPQPMILTEPPSPVPIEYRDSVPPAPSAPAPSGPSPAAAAADQDDQYESAPERPREGGYTIDPRDEDAVFNQSYGEGGGDDGEGAPSSSVEGPCCGGFILTGPTPTDHDYMDKRSAASSLRTPPYRGLGQDDKFWYAPEIQFERVVPTSPAHPNEKSIHRGSKVWGNALQFAPKDDVFNDRARRARRHHRRHGQSSGALPF